MKWILILVILPFAALADTNYCHDAKTNQQWQELYAKYSHHPEWMQLYRLRVSLCRKVDDKELSIVEAQKRFESEQQRLTNELRERLEKKHGKQRLSS